MRSCVITDVQVEYEQRPLYSIGGRYAGYAPGSDYYRITIKMQATPDAARSLQAFIDNRIDKDPVELLQDLGVQQKKRPVRYAELEGVGEFNLDAKPAESMPRLEAMQRQVTYVSAQLVEARKALTDIATLCGVILKKGTTPEGQAARLLRVVEDLRTAALPPYEPKTEPAVPRCPECGSATIVRLARRTQKEFTGCSSWPACVWIYKPPPKAEDPTAPGYARRKLEID